MDEGHGQPAHIPNTSQCQYPPHHSPSSSAFTSQSRDAHHYDPVHNTESWHGNANNPPSRPGPPYAGTISTPQWTMPAAYSWQGFGEAHSGSQGPDIAYQQPPGFAGTIHSPWGEPRGFEPHSASFGYIPGMYSDGPSNGPNAAARSSLTASLQSQVYPMRRHPTTGPLPDDYIRQAARTRNDAVRALDAQLRAEAIEAADLPTNSLQISGSYDYHHSLDNSRSRRHDNHDWDSEDDDDLDPDTDVYSTNPYRAGIMFNGDMDEERRMAAARGAAMAARKSVPSKAFIASLEKLDPMKDLKEGDRTCMICYNEFGIQNPDGIIEEPIRLPKCKHVFGDKCIKKWFEDSDSCPYCRDKLPSEHVHRKHPVYEHLYAATHPRRVHMAAAASAQVQAQSARIRAAGYLSRASEGMAFETGPSRDYSRHLLEEYHYLMRGSGVPDGWSSYSPPNRSRESENRRRQARGRASGGRPTSVGSARLVASGPPNHQVAPMRAHLQNITPNTLNSIPTTAPRRSITPGLSRQHSTGSAPTVVTPPRSRLSEASSPSSEEASPPVAVGSGIATEDRHSPPGGTRPYRSWNTGSDPYESFITASEGHPPGRRPRGGMEPSDQAVPSDRSRDSDYLQRYGDFGSQALGGSRWSR
ncbi:putative RING finger [Hyphodiscus hymeniophilus]|uniref:RING finger n=1 Tax=Hyphodiscus hymeniophilus TaxID=353542 RepID=A0A9P7AZB2_9HELO|nr:putative RING finger [Hyphodiscus hymeniophilus]